MKDERQTFTASQFIWVSPSRCHSRFSHLEQHTLKRRASFFRVRRQLSQSVRMSADWLFYNYVCLYLGKGIRGNGNI